MKSYTLLLFMYTNHRVHFMHQIFISNAIFSPRTSIISCIIVSDKASMCKYLKISVVFIVFLKDNEKVE